jgi:hypothetical protein
MEIDRASIGPSTNAYKNRFGSLTNVFRLVGFRTHRLGNRANLKRIRDDLFAQITTGIICRGGAVRRPTGHNCMLRVNEELNVLVVIGRTSPSNIARHQNQWRFGYRCEKKPDLLVVARVNNDSRCVRDFYLLPFRE